MSEAVLLGSESDLGAFERVLFDPHRACALVGIAPREGSREPVITPSAVRYLAGPQVLVYVVADEALLALLETLLGPQLTLPAGALRVWWPGLSVESDPERHPLIVPLADESLSETLGEFARRFDLSRPAVSREIRLISDSLALAETNIRALRGLLARARQDVRDAHRERHREAIRAEGSLSQHPSPLDGEQRLHRLILDVWLDELPAPVRREHPLRYVLAEGFVAKLSVDVSASARPVAYACAMIGCGYASNVDGLHAAPLLTRAAHGRQVTRADGASGWRCTLKQPSPGMLQIDYWVRNSGVVEFSTLAMQPTPDAS